MFVFSFLFSQSRDVVGHVTLHLLEDRLGEVDGYNDDWKYWTGQTSVEALCATSVTPSTAIPTSVQRRRSVNSITRPACEQTSILENKFARCVSREAVVALRKLSNRDTQHVRLSRWALFRTRRNSEDLHHVLGEFVTDQIQRKSKLSNSVDPLGGWVGKSCSDSLFRDGPLTVVARGL